MTEISEEVVRLFGTDFARGAALPTIFGPTLAYSSAALTASTGKDPSVGSHNGKRALLETVKKVLREVDLELIALVQTQRSRRRSPGRHR